MVYNEVLTNLEIDLTDVQVIDLPKPKQKKIVIPSKDDQSVFADEGKELDEVIVKGVTADIDENIKAENIKLGVNILGIEGNVAPDKPDQEKTIYPSEEEQVVVADLGYELAKVISKPVETESVRVEPSTSEQVVKASEGKYIKEFTVGAVEDLDGEIAEQEVILAELEAQVNDFDDKGDFDVESIVDEAKGTQILVVNGKNDAVEPLDITQNGEYNVARYKEVNVDVADMLQARVDEMNSCRYLFYYYYGTSLDIKNLDTSSVTDMTNMFSYCSQLLNLDLSNFDTTNVTKMANMFERCTSLTNITFGENFNTSNVTDMSYMFNNCQNLTDLDLSKWNTSKVTNIAYMFSNCYKLAGTLDLSHFDISKIGSTGYGVFSYCKALTNVILPSTIKDIGSSFFNGCNSLTEFTILAETPPTLQNTTNCISTATTSIYVPDASVDAYKGATNWSTYADLIKPLSSKGV